MTVVAGQTCAALAGQDAQLSTTARTQGVYKGALHCIVTTPMPKVTVGWDMPSGQAPPVQKGGGTQQGVP